jgi:hypothetical protein
MKTYFKLLILSLFAFNAFGQAKFTAATFNQIMAKYKADPVAWFKSSAVNPNFTFSNVSGSVSDIANCLKFYEYNTDTDRIYSKVKINQVGNTAVATGLFTHKFKVKASNEPKQDDVIFTYAFAQNKGAWQMLSAHHTAAKLDFAAEENIIKTLLLEETKNAYALKHNEVADAFIQKPTTFRLWNIRTGYDTQFGWEAIDASNKKDFGAKPRIMNPENENYTFKFYGNNTAIVTCDQYMYGKNQKPSKELRILEKTAEGWKIAGLVALTDYSHNAYEDGNIRKTIETETKAYHDGNVELLKSQWADNEYIERQQQNLKAAGSTFFKGKNLTAFSEEFLKTHKPTGFTTKMSDYSAHMSGAQAWATFTQETINSDGTSRKTRELRILERIGGSWKIVLTSIQDI